MQKALIHRYDNKADILEVEKHCCSEVYRQFPIEEKTWGHRGENMWENGIGRV
jgi:hypothetical protein